MFGPWISVMTFCQVGLFSKWDFLESWTFAIQCQPTEEKIDRNYDFDKKEETKKGTNEMIEVIRNKKKERKVKTCESEKRK